jgi:hypothetical protein
MTTAYVVTTIQEPSDGVRAIAAKCLETGSRFYVIGDRKTPRGWACPGVDFLGFDEEPDGEFSLTRLVRPDSYTRKMLGYLAAAASGASWICETDDDNAPYPSFFDAVATAVHGRRWATPSRFVNIYGFFTDRHVWPRGFPLRLIRESNGDLATEMTDFSGPMVLQAVADGDPDVDAVYRLTAPDTSDIQFDAAPPLIIEPGAWTPFNSQATVWPISLLPLMYLPATCSFRMTDIWRSYIAQRLFPGLGARLVITAATVFQARNEHDLMRDFQDEIEGYTGYERFVDVLEEILIEATPSSVLADLRLIYLALIDAGFFTSDEMPILDAWIADMESLGFGPTA